MKLLYSKNQVSLALVLIIFFSLFNPIIAYAVGFENVYLGSDNNLTGTYTSTVADGVSDSVNIAVYDNKNNRLTTVEATYKREVNSVRYYDFQTSVPSDISSIQLVDQHSTVTQLVYKDGSIPSFTGFPFEWNAINHNVAISKSNLIHLKAVQRDNNLYLNVAGRGLDGESTFYLDSDNNLTTGYNLSVWGDSSGIDYKIINQSLYKYENGNWIFVSMISLNKSDSMIEASIDLTALGITIASNLQVGFVRSGNDTLPGYGSEMLVVNPPSPFFGPEVTISVDAEDTDWNGIAPIGTSADSQTKMYAAINHGYLYILAKGVLGTFNDIFVDTDNSAITGFNYWGWPSLGGDYLLENGSIYKSMSMDWDWSELGQVQMNYAESMQNNDKVIEMAVPLSAMGVNQLDKLRIALVADDIVVPVASASLKEVVPALPTIQVDGVDQDWKGLSPIARGEGVIQSVYGFMKNNILNILSTGTHLNTNYRLLIDSDDNSTTGYQSDQYDNSGVDYMVDGGTLFKSEGTSWSWSPVSDMNRVTSSVYSAVYGKINQPLEMSVDLSNLPHVSDTVRVAFSVGDDYAPAKRSSVRFPAVINRLGSPIIVDGNDLDWGMVPDQVFASADSVSLRAVQSQNRLFALVEGNHIDSQNTYYIDSDNNSHTGYQSPVWPNSGIDYKVEYGYLYRYASESSLWIKAGPVDIYLTDQYVMMSLYLDMLGKASPTGLKLAYTNKNNFSTPEPGYTMLMVDTTVNIAERPTTYYPRESFAPLNNPYMGWVPSAQNTDNAQPLSLVHVQFTWKDLEPQKGVFNWEAIEKVNQFARWTKENKKFVLRFVLDYPTDDPNHMDIPDWLYNELVSVEGVQNAGVWYNNPSRAGFSPNYNSPVLISEHERVINAIAERYNNDTRVAFIQIGSLGHWGEFHNYPEEDAGKFPDVSISDRYVNHYLNNFTNPLLGMRKPFPIAAQNSMGLFNDIFGDKEQTNQWLGWIQNGWDGITEYVYTNPREAQDQSIMPEFWKHSYSGGEFHEGNAKLSIQDDTVVESMRVVRESHTSWLGPASPSGYRVGDDIQENVQANIDALLKTMGYRFLLESISHPSEANAGESVTLNTYWNNKGVAPFYFNWPLAFALSDPNGNIVSSSITTAGQVDIRKWLPGYHKVNAELNIPGNLPGGEYTLLVAILDPTTGKPGVNLAIDSTKLQGWSSLDKIMIYNNLDQPPTAPTNIAIGNLSDTTVEVIWAPSYDDVGVAGYEVFKDGLFIGSTGGTNYRLTGLTRASNYNITVRAFDDAGNRSGTGEIVILTDGTNKLTNGGFESVAANGQAADGWIPAVSSGVQSDLQVVMEPTYSGDKAQRISGSSIASGDMVAIKQAVSVESGKPYVISANLNISELSNSIVQLYIDFNSESGQVVSSKIVEYDTTTLGYIPIKIGDVVPQVAATASIYLILRGIGDGASGTIYVDDVDFHYGTEDVVGPTVPTNLTKVWLTDTSLSLSWNASSDLNGVMGYDVYNGNIYLGSTTGTSFQIADLSQSEQYTFKVRASDTSGNWSNYAMLTVLPYGTNLLSNAGFETYTGNSGVANGWNISNDYGATLSPIVASNYVFSGTSAQYLEGSSIQKDKMVAIKQLVNVEPNNPYSFKARVDVKALQNAKIQLYVDFNDANGDWVAGDSVEHATITNGYTLLRLDGMIPQQAAEVSVYIILRSTADGASGSIYVDDAEFSYVDEPTPPTNLRIAGSSESSIDMTWDASTDNVGVAGYEIYSGNTFVGSTTLTSYTVHGLAKATMYTLKIRAYDAKGNRSEEAILSAVTDGANILENGGFEVYSDTQEIATGWKATSGSEGVPNRQVVSDPIISGAKAQLLEGSSIPNGKFIGISQMFKLVPNKPYVAGAYLNVQALNNAKVQLYIDFFDQNGDWLTSKEIERLSTTNGYHALRANGEVPQGAGFAYVHVLLKGTANGASGKVYVDDVDFHYGTEDVEAPSIPSNLLVSKSRMTSIELSWSPSTDNRGIANYEIYMGNQMINSTPSTSFRVTGLEGASSYQFTVVAIDAAGNRSDGANLTASTFGGNLISNPGFDSYTGTNEVADNWKSSVSSGASPSFQAALTTPSYNGTKVQKISSSSIPNGSMVAIKQSISVEGGKIFNFSGYVNVQALNGAKVQLYVDFSNKAGDWVGSKVAEYKTTTDGFIQLKTSGTIPEGATKASVYVILRGTATGGSGTLFVEDVNFSYKFAGTYKYDTSNKLESIIFADGSRVDYIYDTNGNLLNVVRSE